ncbi:hypothetical protein NMY22_g17147 [Coprinellus aureogranulatus]|nr:hypothetical protein NMY22_g17147 [Coprinellus aureogranulatus]
MASTSASASTAETEKPPPYTRDGQNGFASPHSTLNGSMRRLPPPLPHEPALPFLNASLPSTPSVSRLREPSMSSKPPVLPLDPPPTVNQVHLHSKKEDIIGTFYVDPQIPALTPGGKRRRRDKRRQPDMPHASFQTRSGNLSLSLGTTGSARDTPKAIVTASSRTGSIEIRLLSTPAPLAHGSALGCFDPPAASRLRSDTPPGLLAPRGWSCPSCSYVTQERSQDLLRFLDLCVSFHTDTGRSKMASLLTFVPFLANVLKPSRQPCDWEARSVDRRSLLACDFTCADAHIATQKNSGNAINSAKSKSFTPESLVRGQKSRHFADTGVNKPITLRSMSFAVTSAIPGCLSFRELAISEREDTADVHLPTSVQTDGDVPNLRMAHQATRCLLETPEHGRSPSSLVGLSMSASQSITISSDVMTCWATAGRHPAVSRCTQEMNYRNRGDPLEAAIPLDLSSVKAKPVYDLFCACMEGDCY